MSGNMVGSGVGEFPSWLTDCPIPVVLSLNTAEVGMGLVSFNWKPLTGISVDYNIYAEGVFQTVTSTPPIDVAWQGTSPFSLSVEAVNTDCVGPRSTYMIVT